MIAEIGKPFKIKFTNNSNMFIELRGDIDISRMSFIQTKSSPYPSPKFEHMGGSKIKILYNPLIPCQQYFEYLFSYPCDAHNEKTSLWNRIPTFFQTIIKRSFFSILVAALFGVAIYTDNKYNEGKIGDYLTPSVWFAEKLSESEDSVESIDTRILTNKHEVYQSEGFKEAENLVNETLDEKIEDLKDDEKFDEAKKLEEKRVSLQDEYWFLGDGLFSFRSTVKKGDKPILVTYEVADDFCDMIGARVISVDEYKIMGGLLVYLGSIFSVSEESKIPEWTRTETTDSDYNKILTKSLTLEELPSDLTRISGSIAGDIEQHKAAFRCTMNQRDFIEAK